MDVSLLNLVVKEYVFGTLKKQFTDIMKFMKTIFGATRRKIMAKSHKTVSKVCC